MESGTASRNFILSSAAEFHHCAWKDVDGRPQMRVPTLPDADTDMNMHAFYVECLRVGLTDLGIVSQIKLYGVRSDSTAATGVDVLQNYKMDADSAAHVNNRLRAWQ